MGVIAKYKFNNTLEANLLPEFNSEFTNDLYTVTDEVNGEVTTRTIESDKLPTLMRFGSNLETYVEGNELALLEVLDMNTSGLTSCYKMFKYCKNLTSITCEWDTSNVTTMQGMFSYCNKLTTLDLNNWDVSDVADMRDMFHGCTSLTSLNVSNWNTKNLTLPVRLFQDCSSLTTLDVNNWDVSKCTNVDSMFRDCSNLLSLDLSNWNVTNNLQHIHQLFYGCTNLSSVGDISNWDVSAVINMYSIFLNCKNLQSINLSNWNTSSATNMHAMFQGCNNLISLDVSNFDTSKVTDMNGMFANINNLKYLKCSNVNTLNTLNTLLPTKSSTSQGTIVCKSDTTNLDTTVLQSKNWNILDEPTLIAKYVFDKSIHNNCIPEFNTEFEGYFIEDEVVEDSNEVIRTIESCGMLPTKIRFGNSNASNDYKRRMSLLKVLDICHYLNNCEDMFAQCENLLSVCNVDTSNVTIMRTMFYRCNRLTSLDVSNFDTSKVTNMGNMFHNCNRLTSLDVSNFDTSKVTNMGNMFHNCNRLTSLDVSNFDTSKVTNMRDMFNSCNRLTSLDVSNFDTSNVTNTINMFANTPLLTDISVLYMDKSSLQKLVDAMPTNSNKTLWYKDVNIDGITHGDNITLKKYMEGNVEIVLNSPLLEGDTIEVKDGKLCHYHKMGKVVLDGSEDCRMASSQPADTTLMNLYKTITEIKENSHIICNIFKSEDKPKDGNIYKPSSPNSVNRNIHIVISKSKLIEPNVNGFKQWLSENPTTIIYELETPYYEDITNLQSAPTLKTYLECSIEIDTNLPIDTNITYRTSLSSVYVMERELNELDNGTDLGDILEGEVNE